jgi:hypothetical protein
MRDIRGDLQDRANLLKQQISATQAQFGKLLEQLNKERNSRLGDLQAELNAVNRLIGVVVWQSNVRAAAAAASAVAEVSAAAAAAACRSPAPK